jgi:hypothetical protein
MAESLTASFVAGFAKTSYPTYIEEHHKDEQRTGCVFVSGENALNLM